MRSRWTGSRRHKPLESQDVVSDDSTSTSRETRGSRSSAVIREFTINADGIRLGEAIDMAARGL